MTVIADISVHLSALRHTFAQGTTRSIEWRETQLWQLDRMLSEREREFEAALHADLGKNPVESQISEIGFLRSEIAFTLKHLRSWSKPQRVAVPPALMPATAWVRPEPLGVVLIIAPWNYPLMLTLSPLLGAIAAGNAVVVKPSEVSQATSQLLATTLTTYLDVRAVRVVEGGVDETTELLKHRFDHIFYTGNGHVARIIARAAAEHLTPTTLELGGKSPLFIDETVNLEQAARRIVWGKFMNAGQTCVAPDYILGEKRTLERLETPLKDAIHTLYGNAIMHNPDYGRIINERQFDRLVGYLEHGRIVAGGGHQRETLFIEPTVLADVAHDAPVMQEEIFGPILPLITVADLDEAIAFVTSRDHPLSAYVFSEDATARRRFEEETISGGLGFGAPVMHLTVPGLPFGGVGESGKGAYHGKRSFDTFSHEKAVFSKPLAPDTLGPTIMPPFTKQKESIVRKLLGKLL